MSNDGLKVSMKVRWEEGIWLGHGRESNESRVGKGRDAVRALATRRRSPQERWDARAITKLKATPTPQDTTEGKTSADAEEAAPRVEHDIEGEPSTEEDEGRDTSN